MLPLQTIDGPAVLPPPDQSSALAIAEVGENRNQKPKTLPCKYCSKRFRRVEHVQRHERTHTKEKPFSCGWDRCGKTFGRRDLLVRHEKLVHLNEGHKDVSRPRKLSGTSMHKPSLSDGHVDLDVMGIHRLRPPPPPPPTTTTLLPPQPSPPQQQQQHQPQAPPPPYHHHGSMSSDPGSHHLGQQDPQAAARTAACNLDLLSDAALASEVNTIQPLLNGMPQQPPTHARVKSYPDTIEGYADRARADPPILAAAFGPQPQQPAYEDYNLFLDDYTTPQHFLPPHFEPDQQMNFFARSPAVFQRGGSKPSSQLPSRFGSLAPDVQEPSSRLHEETSRSPLRISVVDHGVIKNRLEEFSSVLPTDFVFPSRYTLTRFLEGYIGGFHEQLPFLHLPTLSPTELAPELLLAILSVGAQYRFESKRGYALWYAAKAIAMEQIRRRHSSEIHALLPNASSYSPHSTRPSPSTSYRHSFASAQSERPITQDTHREPYSPNTPQSRLETIQAVLLLFSSTLAILIREEGLTEDISQASVTDWDAWIKREGATRTKLIAYSFFNLCSIAYDLPPLLVTSELRLSLPLPARLWRAETAWQWQELRQSTPMVEITVHEAIARLFGRTNQGLPNHLSSLGFYVLIHVLIQHVYFLKQTSLAAGLPFETQRTLKPEDVEEVTQALRVWHTTVEQHHYLLATGSGPFASTDFSPGGLLAYNATALLRLAYIRLYSDAPPCRELQTRDSMLMASAMISTPLVVRSVRLHGAVFQAVHALSMLVKAGVNYVARTKSTEWSIQHSLCNFECALLLAKWLLTLASLTPSDAPISLDERNLLETVRRMLDETEFAVPMETATTDPMKLRQLASAVVRLWAETFKGTHIFDMIKTMGASLDGYADLVDKPRDRVALAPATSIN
ncbi:fungal specific transcription factor domain-containing protein [Trichoderma breve]|uniref:Fungal specific transcription factor domain-containing protein n=1 Tax=Trichoderma breve TaxID=2034170 RepID=A0A9W9E7A5_9HYPO|nr:fungal specific transcription factor domain-containing protein [Trichoderma breve]KAJ4861693.1 fungal specific transcription factor domain-containing protein [Trichoderma breve]